jgi:predicted metal-dependent hydrolase
MQDIVTYLQSLFRRPTCHETQQQLPAYTVRVSARAKHVRLKVSATQGLEVIVPRGFDERQIPALLETRRSWLEKTMAQFTGCVPVTADESLPEQVSLAAVGQTWRIRYMHSTAASVSARSNGEQVVLLQGNVADQAACRAALQRWLVRHAREILVPWLQGLSYEHGLPFKKTTVRTQKTRWASCSSRGTISINSQLLFLEKEQVDYVFLHELCHTVHMNHSPGFWALLENILPDYKKHHSAIQNNWKNIPAWVRKN